MYCENKSNGVCYVVRDHIIGSAGVGQVGLDVRGGEAVEVGAGGGGVGAHVGEHEPVPHAHLWQLVPGHHRVEGVARRPEHRRRVRLKCERVPDDPGDLCCAKYPLVDPNIYRKTCTTTVAD